MKGLPRRPRQLSSFADTRSYLAVPYGEIKAASAAGAPADAFKNARVTRFSRTVVSVGYGETFRLESQGLFSSQIMNASRCRNSLKERS